MKSTLQGVPNKKKLVSQMQGIREKYTIFSEHPVISIEESG